MNVPSTFPALDLNALFPFKLDQFQRQAIAALDANRSVVVCAPTGSGKTLVGEYAIYRALSRGGRVFYTTPLKALSNQKLRNFRELFGAEQVGLLTGDASINRDAPILVMTTEIFRNMLYGTRIGEVGISLVGVETVVLDECHYMNDRQRGTVWEESIIYCPPDIQLAALSATVANSSQLTDWISRAHGETELIYSNYRPVPLEFHFCSPKGLFPLLDTNGKKINPRLKSKRHTNDRVSRQDCPSLIYVISQLWQRDMLPAIYFIFSRRGCDQAVADLENVTLVNEAEAHQLKTLVDDFLLRNPEAGRAGQIDPLYRGIAAHHAGILPAWKGLVEELFQLGLVKVVFATETLAAGINMPARTTVISSLSKRTDRGHRLLTASEFLQMAGRAGRRGMDDLGHVVTVQTPFEGAKDAAYLATAQPEPLVSQFAPSYGMVLNLLQTHSLDEAKDLVERSFGQYLANLYLQPEEAAIALQQAELDQIDAEIGQIEPGLLANYQKLHERLKEERRILKILEDQATENRSRQIAQAIHFATPGTILHLKGKHVPVPNPIPSVLVTKAPGRGQAPFLVCLSQDNRWYIVASTDVAELHSEEVGWSAAQLNAIANLLPPEELQIKLGQSRKGNATTAEIANLIPYSLEPLTREPEVLAQLHHVESIKALLETHPIRKWGNPGNLLKRHARREALQQEITQRQEQLKEHMGRHWREFLQLIEILQRMDGLIGLVPTELGEGAAAIRGDNELWLGLAITSGILDDLAPQHLAAACASLVTETPRSDSWTNYVLSSEVETALGRLKGIRRQLFQTQRRYRVALPVWLESELMGLVENWALGVEWLQLCANTNLDEGDVVRILRRTVDFLSQIPHVPHISTSLQRNAYRAIHLIDRFPVNEVIA